MQGKKLLTDILVTSRNGDRKIMQSIRITSKPLKNKEVESVKSVITYRKDISWLHFSNESRVKERQQVKDQQSCISIFLSVSLPQNSK